MQQVGCRNVDDTTSFAHGLEQLLSADAQLFELHVCGTTTLREVCQDPLAHRPCFGDHCTGLVAGGIGGLRVDFDVGVAEPNWTIGQKHAASVVLLATRLGASSQHDSPGFVVGATNDRLRFAACIFEHLLGLRHRLGVNHQLHGFLGRAWLDHGLGQVDHGAHAAR